ncbi:unnamed protein product [Candidula unifasciata]|uniref:Microsomal glutathione S-transferase 2 n=1 Tax=Candidula unifasciata TaxID=100452 RepID=A0A8S4A823_9EUPU|nr:unnamed protein product [Candidula unifasciata]
MSREIDRYVLPAAVTLAGTYQLAKYARAVGAARHKFNISPPDVTGPPEFIRTYRAHQNTFEFYPMSLTSLWLGSVFFHPVPSSLLYTGYLYGRYKYFHGYVEDADKRLTGFVLSARCLVGLMILSLLGISHKAIRYFHGADLFKLAQERLGC